MFKTNPNFRPATMTRDGYAAAGLTSDRPKNLSWREAGVMFMDQELGKPIHWDGEKWIDALGQVIVDTPPAPVIENAAPETAPESASDATDAEQATDTAEAPANPAEAESETLAEA